MSEKTRRRLPRVESRSGQYRHRYGRRNSWLATLVLITAARLAEAEQGVEALALRIGSGNPQQGKLVSEANRCQECHGADGNSGMAKIPHHAGQYAGYLVKQLGDFQTGRRKHETMSIMAEDLSGTEMADIAAYFAGQKIMQGDGGGDNPVAGNLFVNGDKTRNIAACSSCHGENGKGRFAGNVFYPAIGGQRSVYLRTQLVNWKLGDRTNSPDGVMNNIARSLSDEEIDALVNYLSGL